MPPVSATLDVLLTYLVEAVLLLSLGIILANVLVETGIFSRLSRLTRPLCRISGLSEPSATAILAIFLNPTAGKALYAGLYDDNKVGKEEIIPTLVMSTFPVVLGESLFRVHLPAAIVLLGPVIGGLHVFLNLFSSFLQMTGAILYTRFVLRKQVPQPYCDRVEMPVQKVTISRDRLDTGMRKAWLQLRRIIPVTVIAVLAFTVLTLYGVMDLIGALFQPVLGAIGLPGESSTALVAQILRSYAGYAVVASLVATGTLVVKTALITLLIGSMMVITLIYIRYTFPLNLSLFGKFGIKITAVSYSCSMTAKLITLGLVLLIL
ncbi:MAG: nucleoside recognition protein [Methanoregulaceae archaeon]|nr:nucleoside recognition protein [Methanoregulaceae archaeon]